MLDLVGTRPAGIVREITDVLAAHAVNIDTLRTETRDAPMSGGRLFEAGGVLEVPPAPTSAHCGSRSSSSPTS